MSRAPKRPTKPTVALSPGEFVLIGMPGVTMPSDWFLARVKWTDGADVLVEQHGLGGNNPFHHLHSIDHVRAVGSIRFLSDYKASCNAWIRDRQKRIHALEDALGRARQAVWTKLDEVAVTVPRRGKSGGEIDPA